MLKFIVIVFAVLFLEVSGVGFFRVASGSMEDTLLTGDTLVVLEYWYGLKFPFSDYTIFQGHKPVNGDILLFRNPQNPNETMVKRCVAVGGQTVRIQAKELFVDGVVVPLPPKGKHTDPSIFPRNTSERDFLDRVTVPDSTIFVLGDNRDFSGDSRVWGFLPKKNLVGKAWIVAFSLDPGVPWIEFKRKLRPDRMFLGVK
jgi:signal peptidase I